MPPRILVVEDEPNIRDLVCLHLVLEGHECVPVADGKFARIIVEDEGPGLPKAARERVWEPFYRLDRDASSAVAGSGIGLSVVRELATKLGGSARIDDSPSGARVVVELPVV